MQTREINWRLVIHVAALVGGVLWGVVGSLALDRSLSVASGSASASWLLALVASGVLLTTGGVTFVAAHTITGRSLGLAAVVGALIGWYVLACAFATGWW